MEEKRKLGFSSLKEKVGNRVAAFDTSDMKEKAQKAGEVLGGKAIEIKDSAIAMKEDIPDKLMELDRMLESSITEYNDAYTLMNDKGVQLFIECTRAVDSISFVETLINSIANRPKTFDAEFEEIKTNRD